MKKYLPLVIIVALLALVFMWVVGYYNTFVQKNEAVATAWSQVENQYQRRFDLVPNLVETVKGIAEQEQTVFLGVTEARGKVGQVSLNPDMLSNEQAFEQFQQAQNELSGALSRLLVTVENYPELRSNENFLALQSQLEGTENRIAVERMRYNEQVRDYNVKAKGIPGRFFVSLFGFDNEKQLFESAAGADIVPEVNFNFNNN